MTLAEEMTRRGRIERGLPVEPLEGVGKKGKKKKKKKKKKRKGKGK